MQRARRRGLSSRTSLERIAPESLTRRMIISFTATSRTLPCLRHNIGVNFAIRRLAVNRNPLTSDGLRLALESTRFTEKPNNTDQCPKSPAAYRTAAAVPACAEMVLVNRVACITPVPSGVGIDKR